MVKGVKLWSSGDVYYSQENNPTEAYNLARGRSGWLETCGPTSAVMCLAAMGKDVTITCPGDYHPQPEEVLMDYFNDPRNSSRLRAVRDMGAIDVPENRVPQYYPVAVYEVFGVRARFSFGVGWEQITKEIDRGRSVQIALKSPSHFVAVVAYDQDRRELVYHDPWGSRFEDGKGGFNRRLSRTELASNVQPYVIVYGV